MHNMAVNIIIIGTRCCQIAIKLLKNKITVECARFTHYHILVDHFNHIQRILNRLKKNQKLFHYLMLEISETHRKMKDERLLKKFRAHPTRQEKGAEQMSQ